MALESGRYTIISKIDDASLGRRMVELADTSPKGIFKIPKDMGPSTTTVSNLDVFRVLDWEVEKLDNGNYKVKANGSIVGAIDGLLFAIIDFEEQIENTDTTEWTLKRDERDTEGDAYVVMAAGQGVGWAAPAGDDEQILVKPILVGLTIPPTFSPSEVFIFKKSDW